MDRRRPLSPKLQQSREMQAGRTASREACSKTGMQLPEQTLNLAPQLALDDELDLFKD